MKKFEESKKVGTELSDEELMKITGGESFDVVIGDCPVTPVPLYGIKPVLKYGITPLYGIVPLYGIQPMYGIIVTTDK